MHTSRQTLFTLIVAVIFPLGLSHTVTAQVAVRIPDKDLAINEATEIGGQLWLATSDGAYRIEGDKAIRIPDQSLNVAFIRSIGREVWLSTDAGIYRVVQDSAQLIPTPEVVINDIIYIKGEVWLLADRGLFRVSGNSVSRVIEEQMNVHKIVEADGQIWLLTREEYISQDFLPLSAYRPRPAYVLEGTSARQVLGENITVTDIAKQDDELWLAASDGAYRQNGKGMTRFPKEHVKVNWIRFINGKTWLSTDNGAYRIDGYEETHFLDKDHEVSDVRSFGDSVWLETNRGAYRVQENVIHRLPDLDSYVGKITNINGETWIATMKGAFKVEGDAVRLIPDKDLGVNDIRNVNGQVWLKTYEGAFVIRGQTAERISLPDESTTFPDSNKFIVQQITSAGERVLFLTSQSVYVVEGRSAKQIPPKAFPGEDSLYAWPQKIGNKTWVMSNHGAYRVDEDVIITITPRKDDIFSYLRRLLLPENWLTSGTLNSAVGYKNVRDGKDPYDARFPRKFQVILEANKESFERALNNGEFVAQERVERSIDSGKHILYMAVRDEWGNTFQSQVQVLVLPSVGVWPPILSILAITLVCLFVILAPVNDLCHSLIMNPWVRGILSFGTIPVIQTILPPVRKHLFRRYRRHLREDTDFQRWQRNYVIPSNELSPERLTKKLVENNELMFLGQSGIGKTSYFKHLAVCYAKMPRRGGMSLIPVFVALERHRGKLLNEMIQAQLVKYGQLTDEKLNQWFLAEGGFLILLDGLNEVDETTRRSISSSIDEYRGKNHFCISSQEEYSEFNWITQIKLPFLTAEMVTKILRTRLADGALSVAEQFSEELLEVYKVPQDLEFGIELLKQGMPLPRTRLELYKAILNPVLNSWTSEGRSDYAEILYRRAYEMLCSYDPLFERSDGSMPTEILNHLSMKKIIIRRGESYYFQHELIRTFLAAKYFVDRWQELITDTNLRIEMNWHPMLELVFLSLRSPDSSRDLMYALLKKNAQLAGQIFRWLNATCPHLCQGWESDFKYRYGDTVLA